MTRTKHRSTIKEHYNVDYALTPYLTKRIDVQINTVANKNIFPLIVNTVRLSAKQQIPLRGHRNDKINISEQSLENEGNFIAIICLLAESSKDLKQSLEQRPRNALYTSKTVQNELLHVIAE